MIAAKPFSFTAVFIFVLISALTINAEVSGDSRNQFGFAESLFAEGDFFRAITEYKRFIFFHPQEKTLLEKSKFRIGECYFRAGRWADAVREFDCFSREYPNSEWRSHARYLKGVSEKNLKQYGDALITLNEIIKNPSDVYYDSAIYQIALIRIDEREWGKAKDTFLLVPKESALFKSAIVMSAGLDRMNEIPRKTPAVAGTLAAVLPGSGHLYTERPKDAIVSFLLNGSFIWAAIELFDNNDDVAGAIVTFFELGWYSGNIYSAINAAHKYNRRAQDHFIERLMEQSAVSFHYDPHTRSKLMMLSLTF